MTIPSGPGEIDYDDLIARLKAEAAIRKRDLPLEPAVMTELALLPEFTPQLLEETGIAKGIPGETTKALAHAGFFDSRPTVPADDGTPQSVYWVRRDARASIGAEARTRLKLPTVYRLLENLQQQVRRAPHQEDVGLSGWLEVVGLLLADWRGGAVLRAVAEADAKPASRLVDIMATLAEVIGGGLPSVVERARALVAVKFRQVEAEKALQHYQRRDDVERWVADALRADEPWAIHLRGDGGVGKTMLLRYIASPAFAADKGLAPFVVAGVDFDHLDPRYPMLRPLLLFETLESQLLFPPDVSTADVQSARARFLDAADAATEAAAGNVASAEDPVAGGIEAFAELVGLTGRKVVLVFDTAEELAKAEGGPHEGSPVEATLSRLQELQSVLRQRGHRPVQVVFAGRRPLRTAPDGSDATPAFVQVREVGGFDRRAAEEYLRRRLPRAGDDVVEALLDRSRPSGMNGEMLYNPFELSIWATWVQDEEKAERELDIDALASEADPFVQRRILARISEPAVRVLMAPAAYLGRFECRFLEGTIQRAGLDARSAIHALADQEWVSVVSRDELGFPDVLEVDEHLQDRLRAAVEEFSEKFPLDRRRLADDIRHQIAQHPLPGQAADPFAALLRQRGVQRPLLSPSDAVSFWEEFERRLARDRAWQWAEELIRRVDPVVEPGTLLSTAMTATCAVAASRRPAGGPTATAMWQTVADQAAGIPDPEGDVLGARARLALADDGAAPADLDVPTAPVEAVAGAVAALLGSEQPRWRRAKTARWFTEALARLDEEGGFVGRALSALGHTRRGTSGGDLLDVAVDLAQARRAGIIGEETAGWVDWAPPDGLVERCALAALAWRPASEVDFFRNAWSTLAGEARSRLADVDAERFLAAYLLHSLDERVITERELRDYEYADGAAYTADRKPTWALHREVPRLVEAVAVGLAGLGLPEHAEDTLRTRVERAVATGADSDTIADAHAALVRLFREYRLDPSAWYLGDVLDPGMAELELAVRLTGTGSRGLRVVRRSRSSTKHLVPASAPRLTRHADRLRGLELRALDDPEGAAKELFALAERRMPGQPVRADMAWVLGVLACARAGVPVPKGAAQRDMESEAFRDPTPLRGKWGEEWGLRLRVARTYALGARDEAAAVASDHPSPELDLAAARDSLSPRPREEPPGETASSAARHLNRVRLAPSPWTRILGSYAALGYAGLVFVALTLLELPLWASIVGGLVALAGASGPMRAVLTRSETGTRLTLASNVLVTVEYPGQGSVATLEVRTGLGLRRFRRVGGFVASLIWAGRSTGRSLWLPVKVTLPESPDGEPTFSTTKWRLGARPLGAVIVEVDLPPLLSALPWEHWLVAAGSGGNGNFVWVRSTPGWPDNLPAKGPPLFAGPDHLANEKVVPFVARAATGSALPTWETGDKQSYPRARLVHIVGVPARTTAGWRLRIESETVLGATSSSSASTRRTNLVAPGELAVAAVVVLQAPPVAAGAEPFTVARDGWLSFAAEALESGAAAVLLVPALGDSWAEQAVDLTTSWAIKGPDDLQPSNVLALLVDLGRLVEQAVRESDLGEESPRPRARDDVIGFVRLLDVPQGSKAS